MSPFAPFTEDQFRQMAMCKARAYSWDTIAETVNMPIEIVERVAWTHEKIWNRFLTKAERHIARETIAEVAVVLRKDIRNTEPHLHATLTNSLSRVLKLQQEFAPPPRRRQTPITTPAPTITPTPVPPTPTVEPARSPLPSLNGTIASLLGFFVLLGALLMGCWNRAICSEERPECVTHEPTPCVVVGDEFCRSGFSLTGPHAPTCDAISSG